MPKNYTENYHLNQWEPEDQVLRADFNEDNAKIDAALAEKAEASVVEGLIQTVTGHTSALDGKGNCRICTAKYSGNGEAGTAGTVSVTFPGKPVLVAVSEPAYGYFMVMIYGSPYAQTSSSVSPINVTWRATGVSWYSQTGVHFNLRNTTYTAVALLAES